MPLIMVSELDRHGKYAASDDANGSRRALASGRNSQTHHACVT
jgi:hypothetical protein